MVTSGFYWMWNHLRFPDEEDDIPEYDRYRPHVTMGRYPDGRVRYINNLGSFYDTLEWVGFEDIQGGMEEQHIRDYLNGVRTPQQILTDIAKSPVNKFAGSVAPWIKALYELPTAQTLYPDIFEPRPIYDRIRQTLSYLGLQGVYGYYFGQPGLQGPSASPAYRWWPERAELALFTAGPLPTEADYNIIREMKFREMDRLSKPRDFGRADRLRSEALRNHRLALRAGDQQAADNYELEYQLLEGTPAGLKQSLLRLDPLDGLTAGEQVDFMLRLSPQDQNRLARAYAFYEDTFFGLGVAPPTQSTIVPPPGTVPELVAPGGVRVGPPAR
jgi:hypothetical protein